MESFKETWNLVLDFCKDNITDVAYNTWISRIQPINLDLENGIVNLMVPSKFHKETVLRCYSKLLDDAFQEIFGMKIEISLLLPDEVKTDNKQTFNNVNDKDYEFTFSNFIVGPSNKFAHAASLAVATNPAKAYNPLFIYGNSGLGKTHLLYAICDDIQKNHPELMCVYVKGDEFTNGLIDSIKRNKTNEFHEKYRNSDVLLVDDIQFIAGKDSTQEEFFHTFNSLYEAQKQIILTSDRPPKEIQTLEDRLRTRFESGLIADIQPPDFETRIAIIKRKAELLDIQISNDVCEYIAKRLKTNIRQLEGTVKKIKAYHLLDGQKIDVQTAQLAISDILNNDQPQPVTIEKIISEVARTFSVSPNDIRSPKRSATVSNARQIAMYIIREITQMSLMSIGEEFGGRDHSTIVYAIQQVEKNIQKNSRIKATIEDIIKNIRGI